MSAEYDQLIGELRKNCRHFTEGALALDLAVLGGETPIVSILVGDEADTLNAGSFLFDRGFYVQSVCFPAVPYHAGVLRVQVNANHTSESINGLLNALAELKRKTPLPGPQELARQAA
jgi:7-keto-8-aminopelargonate synthetase-like enzyme